MPTLLVHLLLTPHNFWHFHQKVNCHPNYRGLGTALLAIVSRHVQLSYVCLTSQDDAPLLSSGVTVICVSQGNVFPTHISLGICVSLHTYH